MIELMTDDPVKLAVAGGATAVWALMSAFTLLGGREKRLAAEACDVLVVSASQTGQAEELARNSEKGLNAGGQKVRYLTADKVSADDLQAAKRILMVVSTTGVGDAPDDGRAFEGRLLGTKPDLSRQGFAVLALGERKYEDFCAFGHRVYDWLKSCGATALKPCLEVDDLDPAALKLWANYLKEWGGESVSGDEGFRDTVLKARRRLNPESDAAGLYQVELSLALMVDGESESWQAGDLAQIRTADGHRRDYSIASLPEEGALRLYVREVIKDDGSRGAGSGLLTHSLSEGQAVPLRLKSHKNFHAPAGNGPVLLIAAGSGLAGLRPHLIELNRKGRACWLIYGERYPEADGALPREMTDWQSQGQLSRLDLAFSRPENRQGQYVQDVLRAKADEVQAFRQDDTAVMVCGGLDMGRAVEEALKDILGAEWLEAALNDGRYRRDLY
ncbi:MAG: NADPH cytochrome P450 oxidoreductase family protein [Asticcacaulis sp.]